MNDAPHFDLHQFAKRSRAVSAETGIAHSDYRRMGKEKREHRKNIPPWANGDEKFRQVILLRLKRYVHSHGRGRNVGLDGTENLRELEENAMTANFRMFQRGSLNDFQQNIVDVHMNSTRNGLAGLWTRIAYLAYRMSFDSLTIGREVGIKAAAVRQHLKRMNECARSINPEWCLPPRVSKPKRRKPLHGAHVARLRERGMHYPEIASRLRYSLQRVYQVARSYAASGGKISLPDQKTFRKINPVRLVALRNQGLSFHKIGKIFRMDAGSVIRAYRKIYAGREMPLAPVPLPTKNSP